MGESDQAIVRSTARIDWRKLLLPSLLIMVLPTISAILLDKWLGSYPFITIFVIVICFPTATIWVIRIAMQEMDRVIAEVVPPQPPDFPAEAKGKPSEVQSSAEVECGAQSSPLA